MPLAIAACMGVIAPMTSAQAVVRESFDTGLNGWSTYADAENLIWNSTGGNPGGAAQADDRGSGGWWGFTAGPAFLGDRSCMYGGVLNWQTKTDAVNTAGATEPDVRIESPGLTLVYDVPNPTANVWAVRSLVLRETSGWKKSTLGGAVPTQAEFLSVLANVTSIKFRGEFTSASGNDVGLIDNVMIAAFLVSSPASITTCHSNPSLFSVTAALGGGGGSFTYQWQWQPTPGGPFFDIAEGLNVDPDSGPYYFVAQNAQTASLTISQYGDPVAPSRWDVRCVVTNLDAGGGACDEIASEPATLIVCPADLGCDGFVNGDDYDAFASLFEVGGLGADLNRDGFVNGDDYDLFASRFEEGC